MGSVLTIEYRFPKTTVMTDAQPLLQRFERWASNFFSVLSAIYAVKSSKT
jgi:hypothetical protein